MPVLSRYRISSFQDVQIDQPAGLVNDGQFSTYTLDDPSITPGGTGDFLGVIKTSVLLGRLVREEIDTRRYTIAALNNLTINQYQEEIANGNIIQNPRSRTNRPEEIGWVELGRSRASFYYKDCTVNGNRGKQPTAEFFYTLGNFNLDGKILRGIDQQAQIFGERALEQIGAYNQADVLNNFGLLGPNFAPIDINEYMTHALAYKIVQLPTATGFRNTTGWYFPNGAGDFLSTTGYRSEQLSNIQLLLATKSEHFDNELTQPYSSGVWARSRETAQGVRVLNRLDFQNVDRFSGLCLPLEEIVIPDDGDDETDLGDENWYGGGISDDEYLSDDEGVYVTDESEEENTLIPVPIVIDEECTRDGVLPLSLNFYPYDNISNIEESGSSVFFGPESENPPGSTLYSNISDDENDVTAIDLFKDYRLGQSGIIDPRDFYGNNFVLPRGTIKGIHNIKKCTIDVHFSLRDKDGDRPEPVGPIVTRYMEDLRNSMMKVFGTPNPLKLIGYGTDGNEYYSDGNSYTELHGESIFGCGKPFTIADVPEIFTEMYPVKVDHPIYGKYGKDENDFVKNYRVSIERPSDFPSWMMSALDWLIDMPAKFTDPRMRVSDLFNDFVLGIPDMDMSIVGGSGPDDNLLATFYSDLIHELPSDFSAIGRLVSDSKKYTEVEDKKQLTAQETLTRYRKLTEGILLDKANPFSDSDLTSEEKEELYKYMEILPYMFGSKEEIESIKRNLPKRISRYKKFDNLWSRSYLNLAYAKNDEEFARLVGADVDYITKTRKINELSSLYYNSTIQELQYLKSKLSVPSRWKSMMRPIYDSLWYNKNEILPSSVSTEPYVIGTSIFELELGDYESHRSSYGASKNLYDVIDDVISLKIDDSIFEDYEPSVSQHTYSMLGDIQSVFNMIASPNLSKNINSIVHEFFIAWEDLKNLAKNKPTDLGSYTRFAEDALRIYSSTSNSLSQLSEIINQGKLPEGFAGPEGPGASIGDFINTDLLHYVQEKITHSLQITLHNALSWAQQEFNRVYPDRSSFSPRRVFKSGDVYLESKSGIFSTNKQPCPIIFLGFNDSVLPSSFDTFNSTNGCVDFLYKNDQISQVKYMREVDFVNPTDTDLISLGDNNLGSLSIGGNTDGARIRYGKIEEIPVINKRFRQYGRNPLFDVFYLNMVPESILGTATPEPFRYPRVEQQKQQLRSTKVVYSYVPSIFPPHWNEPIVKDGPPRAYEQDNSMFLHGDLQDFHNRRRNNILTASDRWSMRLDQVGNANVVVLKDKTRILDIYYGLMRMHVLGFGWAEIRDYANQARNAVKIKSAGKRSLTQSNGTSIQIELGSNEEESTIDLDKLELIWDKIKVRLDGSVPLYVSTPENWFTPMINNIEDISTALNSPSNKPIFSRTIKIYNNTQSEVKIKSIRIVDENQDQIDTFQQKSSNLFFFSADPEVPTIRITPKELSELGTGISRSIYNEISILNNMGNIPIFPLRPSFTDVISYNELTLWFIPYGAQNGFTYGASLEITSEWGGEEYVTRKKLVGKPYASEIQIGMDGYVQPIEIRDHIIFPTISDINSYDQSKFERPIEYFNKSNENIILESFKIENERILDIDGEDITSRIVDDGEKINFFVFKEGLGKTGSGEVDSLPEKFIIKQTIVPAKLAGLESINYTNGPIIQVNKNAIISNGTYRPNLIYMANLVINYTMNPRINSNNRISKSVSSILLFNTRVS